MSDSPKTNGALEGPPGPSIQVDDLSPLENGEEGLPDGEAIRTLKRTVRTHTEQIHDLTQEYGSLSGSLSSLENEHEELSADHNRLQGYINEEVTNLQTILEHLIEETEANGASINELRERRERLAAERERLIELKEATIRLGIETATCESCETDIDLRTLASPTCPQCSSTFSDITQDTKWLGLITSNTITTANTGD